jgi:hypothetical protein
LKFPSKVSDQKKIWRVLFPIALLALLLGTTLGEVWHHHANSLPDTCPICQLSHQAIEPPPTGARVYILVPTGPGPEPQLYNFIPRPVARHIPVRAPPA